MTEENKDAGYKALIKAINRDYPIKIPFHQDVVDYLKIIFTPEQAMFIGTVFEKPFFDMVNLPQLAERAKEHGFDYSPEEITALLEPPVTKGILMKIGESYAMLPFVPGLFEFYFSAQQDTPENMKKVAEQMEKLRDGPVKLLYELIASDTPVFRILPHAEPVRKTIEINKSFDAQTEILPLEIGDEYLKEAVSYSLVDCSCRLHSRYTEDEPCKKTLENGDIRVCMALGPVGFGGMGSADRSTSLTYEEAVEFLKKTEKAGMVHSVMNTHGFPMFICNCCECHCGILKAAKETKNPRAVVKSNFLPRIDHEKCVLCEDCIEICPMDALFRYFPRNENLDDDHIQLIEEMCIGCGVCATNCPAEAIALVKVKNDVPENDLFSFFTKSNESRIFSKE